MKAIDSFNNLIPLHGCTVIDLSFALKQNEYFTPALLSLMKSATGVSEDKSKAINTIATALYLMNTHSIYVDFPKEMILAETEDSKEFYVCYLNNSDLNTNLIQVLKNLSINLDQFVIQIKDTLDLHREEIDSKKLWDHLVDMSITYLDTK